MKKERKYFENDELRRIVAPMDDSLCRTLCLTALRGPRCATGNSSRSLGGHRARRVCDSRQAHDHGRDLSETKNRENRRIHLTPHVTFLLEGWYVECGSPDMNCLVFPGDAGGYLSSTAALCGFFASDETCQRAARRAEWSGAYYVALWLGLSPMSHSVSLSPPLLRWSSSSGTF